MRIQYKGGVWKNSEDEILKAAVMKYGQNQWARIASLLVRKSAKQCKARWYEWLDPSIKKTQWTREEEEKLLHLVKVMPTQWRTIAPMVGRTAAQCIEHYEKLIDQAQQRAGEDGAGPSTLDPKAMVTSASRQRPGDLDAAPESKPARPDPVDMDEDELEMLSEARARLANTKGKKAKRKAREKQLEAAKRVAQLQKRRELKAAGVPIKPSRKNRKVTDYATEIPFERAPAPGFYDTREEDDRAATLMTDKKQIGKLLQKYMGSTEAEKEEEARKKDTAKRRQMEKTNLPAALGFDKLVTADAAPRSPPLKRARFSLPPPQLSDAELENIAKSGNPATILRRASVSNTESEVASYDAGNDAHSQTPLASSTAGTRRSTPAEPWAAIRQRHLETIMALKSAETPLRGGENTPLQSLGLEGRVLPTPSDLRTPNPLATPSFATGTSLAASNTASSSRKRKETLKRLQAVVKEGLATLPDPENEYELDFGEEQKLSNGDDATDLEKELVEDAEEEEGRKRREAEKQISSIKTSVLSSAAFRDLPVPFEILCSEGEMDPLDHIAKLDRTVLNIVNRSDGSTSGLMKTARELKALASADCVREEDIRRAKVLLDEYIAKDGVHESREKDILQVLESGDAETEKVSSLAQEELRAMDVSARNSAKFQKEREERLGQLQEMYKKHRPEAMEKVPNTKNVWKLLKLEIPKEVGQMEDEQILVKYIRGLREQMSNVIVPSSLSAVLKRS